MKAIVWVDAGPAFGLGHVSRGLALADALAARRMACRFALPADATALAWLREAGHRDPVVLAETAPALAQVLGAATDADTVIVDVRHPLDTTEVRALGGNRPVVVVDNAGPGVAEADLVVAPFGEALDARWLTGPAWVPLRPFAPAARARRGRPVVLVSMGASDPGRLTLPAVAALGRLSSSSLLARVVANPASPVWSDLPAALGQLGFPAAMPIDFAGMGAHLAAADVAVLAMGVTVYEAMAAGVPAVVLSRTSADAAHARALAREGAIVSVGVHWSEQTLAEAVVTLLEDDARRAAMSAAGRRLVDGRGAARVAERVVRLVTAERRGVDAGDRPRA